ncbi:hypothetical protein [Microbispora bryophytorum]|uniref:hypothetical protein n=1 Tax=Microbispora bryophytorum TaxID=1460882 RepID=UPI0033C0CC0C
MTRTQTPQTIHCPLPLWNDATEEYHNAYITYRTNDPFFVRLEIEDWPFTVDAPRTVLRDGVTGLAECLSEPGGIALRVQPASDGVNVLLGVTQGDLLLGVFRTYADAILGQLRHTYAMVPEGEEMTRIDWDLVIACMDPRDDE